MNSKKQENTDKKEIKLPVEIWNEILKQNTIMKKFEIFQKSYGEYIKYIYEAILNERRGYAKILIICPYLKTTIYDNQSTNTNIAIKVMVECKWSEYIIDMSLNMKSKEMIITPKKRKRNDMLNIISMQSNHNHNTISKKGDGIVHTGTVQIPTSPRTIMLFPKYNSIDPSVQETYWLYAQILKTNMKIMKIFEEIDPPITGIFDCYANCIKVEVKHPYNILKLYDILQA